MSLQKAASAFLSQELHPQPAVCSDFHLLEFGIKSENGSTGSSPPVLSQSACMSADMLSTHVPRYASVVSTPRKHFHFPHEVFISLQNKF